MKQVDSQNTNLGGMFLSITSILKDISKGTTTGNAILESIQTDMLDSIDYGKLSISNILSNQINMHDIGTRQISIMKHIRGALFSATNMLSTILQNMEYTRLNSGKEFVTQQENTSNLTDTVLNPIVNLLTDIRNFIFKLVNKNTSNQSAQQSVDNASSVKPSAFQKIEQTITNVLDTSLINDKIYIIFESINLNIMHGNTILEDILTRLDKIYMMLPTLGDSKRDSEKTTTETGAKTKSTGKEFAELFKNFSRFKKELTKQFVKNFTDFVTQYEKFVDEKNTKKLMAISLRLSTFTTVLKLVSKFLESTKSAFKGLTTSIWLLTLTLLLPPFQLGFAYLIGILKTLSSILGTKKSTFLMIVAMRRLSISIVMLVGAVWLLGKLKFGVLVKFVAFLTLLAGALRLFSGNKGGIITGNSSITRKFGVSGIFSAAVGIAVLVLAVSMTSSLNFAKAVGLITFIGGLATVMFIFNRKKIGKRGPLDSLMNVSIGLSILILAVDAVGEVNWVGALLMMSGFIIGLGLAIMLANKMMGSSRGGKLQIGANVSTKGMFGFALGIAILILSIDATNELDWYGALKLLMFIAALGFVVSLPSLLTKGKMNGAPLGGMLGFSFGMGLLILAIDAASEVEFEPAWKVLAVMSGVVLLLAIGKKIVGGPKLFTLQIMAFSGAIVTFAGALWAISKINIDYNQVKNSLLCLTGFIGIMVLVSLFSKQIQRAAFVVPYLIPSVLALVGLTFMVSLLHVNLEQVEMFGLASVIMIGVTYLAALAGNKIIKGAENLVLIAGSNLTTAFTVSQISKLQINFEGLLMFALSSIVMIGITYLVSKIGVTNIAKGAAGLLIVSSASLIMAFAVYKINQIQFSLEGTLTYVLTTALLVAACFGLSFIVVPVLLGAAAMLAVGAASLITAFTVMTISNIQINFGGIGMFILSTLALVFTCVAVIPFAPFALLGAGLLFAVGTASFIAGLTLLLIQSLNVTPEAISGFTKSVIDLSCGLAKALPALILASIASAFLTVVAASALLTAGLFSLMNELEFDVKKIDNFKTNVKLLMDAYSSFGIIAVGKAALKATLLLPVIVVSSLAAIAFKEISALKVSPESMKNFGITLEMFLSSTLDAINKALPALESAKPGISALLALVNVGKGLMDIVQAYADLKVGEWRYNNTTHKMEIYKYKKIDDSMFERAGMGIGKLLQALVKPLTVISSDSDTWDFGGGVKVKNPFKGGWFGMDKNSGTNRIKKIGEAFTSITGVIKNMSGADLLYNESKFKVFKVQLPQYFQLILNQIDLVGKHKYDGLAASGKAIADFYAQMSKINYKAIDENSAQGLNKFLTTISDGDKWARINKNLKNTNNNLKQIVANINKIDIKKATALEKNLSAFANVRTVEGIRQCIEELRNLISIIDEHQKKQEEEQKRQNDLMEQQQQQQNSLFNNNGTMFPFSNNNNNKNNVSNQSEKEILQQILDRLQSAFDVKVTNNKLKVEVTNTKDFNGV